MINSDLQSAKEALLRELPISFPEEK